MNYLKEGDLLVFNNSRVIPARLFGKKDSGGMVEILIERTVDENLAWAMVRSNKKMKMRTKINFVNHSYADVIDCRDGLFLLSFSQKVSIIMDLIGQTPIPPYLNRDAERIDSERYQTVYASAPGAIAAPTAGLHFDEPLLNRLKNKGINSCFVTLHVGLGTFKPVKVDNIKEHSMHSEWISVSKKTCDMITETKKNGGRVVAVGTTSLRSLETIAIKPDLEPFQGDTDIFICPGYEFKLVDALITNFHLPKSTLLMLVCAFAGYSQIMDAYKEAINKKYRFYSYGDAMFLNKNIDAKFDLPGL
jgi:S-adenosylmethionine:tRNA ribosyltransferase-isomerase